MWDITNKELDELEKQAKKTNFIVPISPETLLRLISDLRMWRNCILRPDTSHLLQMDINLEILVNKVKTLKQCGDLFDELIIELKKTCAERDWLAEMVVAVHESGYCPPHVECPVGNALPSQEDCKDCWVRAAREAVERKQ